MAPSPQILIVIPNFNGGGAERVAVTIANELSRTGIDVQLAVFNRTGPLSALVSRSVIIHDLQRKRLRRALSSLLKLISEVRPYIIFSTLGYINLALLALKILMPRGVRLWIREANLPSMSLKENRWSLFMQVGYRIFYPKADLIIATSNRMRIELIKDFRVNDQKIRILCNPIDETQIRLSLSKDGRSPSNTIRFVAAGRLTRQKGFDRLLDMFASISHRDAILYVIGEGPLGTSLMHRAEQLGIAARVVFMGFQNPPWFAYSSGDAFLLPSRWEGMPNVALEALACGVPVIATPECGGISEVAMMAERGALTIVEAGQPFIDAMDGVRKRNNNESPSLLPRQFSVESVVANFRSWIVQSE